MPRFKWINLGIGIIIAITIASFLPSNPIGCLAAFIVGALLGYISQELPDISDIFRR